MIKRYFSFYRFWPLLLLLLFSSGWYLIDKFYDQQVINQQERYLANKGELFLEIANQKIETLESFIQLKSLEDNERLTVLDEKGNILFDSFDPNLSGQRSDRPEVRQSRSDLQRSAASGFDAGGSCGSRRSGR